MGISTHVLDTVRGAPASGIAVTLERMAGPTWAPVGAGTTNADGRSGGLLEGEVTPGTYRLSFAVASYFSALGMAAFYPVVEVTFDVAVGEKRCHVPLLLGPFGYTTYRGS